MKADHPRLAQQKLSVFWWVYIVDKGLSLRLGRHSIIQDYDIDVPTILNADPQADAAGFRNYFSLTIACARVQGKVYDQLYSAGALNVTPQERETRVYQLAEELSVLREQLSKNRVSLHR